MELGLAPNSGPVAGAGGLAGCGSEGWVARLGAVWGRSPRPGRRLALAPALGRCPWPAALVRLPGAWPRSCTRTSTRATSRPRSGSRRSAPKVWPPASCRRLSPLARIGRRDILGDHNSPPCRRKPRPARPWQLELLLSRPRRRRLRPHNGRRPTSPPWKRHGTRDRRNLRREPGPGPTPVVSNVLAATLPTTLPALLLTLSPSLYAARPTTLASFAAPLAT